MSGASARRPAAATPRPRADGLPHVIAVFGPTASGKSAVAEALADALGGEVVSCDAMQCYAGVPILTNQPKRPTRLVGIWPLAHAGSVGEYQALAHREIDELAAAGRVAVVAGGTGLYLRAALAAIELPPAPHPGLRERMALLAARLGAEGAHAELARRDPAAARALHPNDVRRVVRALELHALGESLAPEEDRLWAADQRLPSAVVGLEAPSQELAARIAVRTARMWERGGLEEARAALVAREHGGLSQQAAQLIGLRETDAGLGREEWIEAVALRTRQYAKRQRVWMRKVPGLQPVAAGDGQAAGAVAAAILRLLRRA